MKLLVVHGSDQSSDRQTALLTETINTTTEALWAKWVRKWDNIELASNKELSCEENPAHWVTCPQPASQQAWTRPPSTWVRNQ